MRTNALAVMVLLTSCARPVKSPSSPPLTPDEDPAVQYAALVTPEERRSIEAEQMQRLEGRDAVGLDFAGIRYEDSESIAKLSKWKAP